MSLKEVSRLLASCFLLFCSTVYCTLAWCWISPPFTCGIFGIPPYTGKGKTLPTKISSPIHDLKSSYDVVVIGSGYGGGVAASRMARAQPKQSVCVLERGIERWPEERGVWLGGFPSSFWEVVAELRVTGHLCLGFLKPWPISIGKANGLYRWICGRDSNAFVATGLGGTSLVNANVFLQPDPRVFQSSEWPPELREPGVLDKYFERAEAMLQPETYPKDLPSIRKYDVLLQQASVVGLEAQCTPARQTVAFRSKTNASGVRLNASKLSGQDTTGLNDGSKNTVLTTYLKDAWNFGAEIYCSCNVRYLRKHPDGGYLIFFQDEASTLPFGTFRAKLRWVHARKLVFLGAGSMGSTEIVLRSQREGLPMSPRVGRGLSGNGGMLSFGYDLDHKKVGEVNPPINPGPTVTGTIDCRDNEDWEKSFIVQDGVFPLIMDTVFRITKPLLASTPPKRTSIRSTLRRLGKILNPFTDALTYTQVYLTLSHDTPCGSLTLKDDLPLLDMRGVERRSTTARIKKLLVDMTHEFGGSFVEQGCKVTVHPLGGLGLTGDGTGRTGSVSHTGELFSGDGSEVHSGLCVVDGSVVSRSLAANPLATITAIAERSVELVAEKHGLRFDVVGTVSTRRVQYPLHALLTFSEKMEGSVVFGDRKTILTLYVDAEISPPFREFGASICGRLSGTVSCLHLSRDQLLITDGVFESLKDDPVESGQKIMEYRFTAVATNGESFVMKGRKLINPSVTLSATNLWKATTNLLFEVRALDENSMGSGMLKLSPRSFIDQLRTLTTSRSHIIGRRRLLILFLKAFSRGLLGMFLSPLTSLQYPEDEEVETKEAVNIAGVAPTVERLKAIDGVTSTLRKWDPVVRGENGLTHDVLFVPGSAVSHLIYASPYIRQNAIEHFTQKGYRCWCLTTRFGKQHEGRTDPDQAWTSYDARHDIVAALKEIERYNVQKSARFKPPYVIAHCVGSLALASALLDGTVHRTAISGITASQIFLHPILQPLNGLKARLPLNQLYRKVAGDWFPICLPWYLTSESPVQSALDALLRFYPLTSTREICNSTACHRCNLAFGRLWNHQNLNKATHDNMGRIFSGTSSRCLQHLASSGKQQAVLDPQYRSMLSEDNIERLRGIPVFLFSGADNNVFRTEATLKTYQVLKARGETVSRKVFPGLGHLDCWMSEKAGVVYEAIEVEVSKAFA